MPHTLFLYWGGSALSWLRFMTVVSFKKLNPDWKIIVYYPTHPFIGGSWKTDEQIVSYDGVDYFSDLSKYADLIPLDMTSIGSSNDQPEVHKSDIFRLWVLEAFGGFYSDFDILYTKPMPKITQDRLFCKHPDGHYAIGLLGAKRGDKMYKQLFERALTSTGAKYQTFGATMWGSSLPKVPEGFNIPKDFVYSYHPLEADKIFIEDKGLPRSSIGLHWYGGSIVSGVWENKLTQKNYKQYDSTICNLIGDLCLA